MKFNVLVVAFIFFVVSPLVLAQVRVLESSPGKDCAIIKQEVCKSKRKDGIVRCERLHKKRADKLGASHIVYVSSTADTENMPLFNDVTLAADYYACEKSAPVDETPSIEERLTRLKKLYDKELITEADYKTRKSEILSEI